MNKPLKNRKNPTMQPTGKIMRMKMKKMNKLARATRRLAWGLTAAALASPSWAHPGHGLEGPAHDLLHLVWLFDVAVILVFAGAACWRYVRNKK